MIGEIYKNAKIVLSWLGTFNEDELTNRELDVESNPPRDRPEPGLELIEHLATIETHS
jgi:hypothetical protein